MTPSERLANLGIVLPEVATPVGSYVPAVFAGGYVQTSGQLPLRGGKLKHTGKVPHSVTLYHATEDARQAMLNAVAAAAQVAGGIDHIIRVVRVGVFVNSSPGFYEQPKVANGASDLLVEIFSDKGRHARAAVGVAELPMNAAVEVELLVEVEVEE